jgi:alpha-amylase/alpha-mannosidase (GH57 family)
LSSPGRTRIVFIWHHHQPSYRDPISGEYILPWVLLHAMRDYHDMPLLAARYEGVRTTFNLVPGLLEQLEEYAAGTARDGFLSVAMKDPAELSEFERRFLIENFFSGHFETMIRPYPRYAELEMKRRVAAENGFLTSRFSDQDLMDLQVWFYLSWCGDSLCKDPRVNRLFLRGKDFTQEDKLALRQAVLDLIAETLPLYRKLAAEGRIEISTSPLYHPILPLLVSTDSARTVRADIPLPPQVFCHPSDARYQVAKARDAVSQRFGQPVSGLWPPEGALDQTVLTMLEQEGVLWTATDERLLARTLNREEDGEFRSSSLHQPWQAGKVMVLFRDARLSDLVGFVYSRWNPETAANHFISELEKTAARSQVDNPVITVALDGENAWEYYLHGGYRFLSELYRLLGQDDRFEMVTPQQLLGTGPWPELPAMACGSWIDGNLETWIGDPVKNQAWEYLTAARTVMTTHLGHSGCEAREHDELMDLVMRAEASDWFWWFGKGHSSRYDPEFDLLFRQHIRAIYLRMALHPPHTLEKPLVPDLQVVSPVEPPVHLIEPTITGKTDSYYKWLSAGRAIPIQGFLHRTRQLVREVRFGFSRENLYFKLEADRRVGPLMRDQRIGYVFHITAPVHLDLRIWHDSAGVIRVVRLDTGADCPHAVAAAESVLEVAVPFLSLTGSAEPVGPDTDVEFYVVVRRRGRDVERFPQTGGVTMTIRGEELDAENWHV